MNLLVCRIRIRLLMHLYAAYVAIVQERFTKEAERLGFGEALRIKRGES